MKTTIVDTIINTNTKFYITKVINLDIIILFKKKYIQNYNKTNLIRYHILSTTKYDNLCYKNQLEYKIVTVNYNITHVLQIN